MREALHAVLPTERVSADVRAVLSEAGGRVELDGKWEPVSPDTHLEVISRSFHAYEDIIEMGFGDHYRVLVAVGGVESRVHGLPRAAICFATLWYSAEPKLITIDFSTELP